MTELDTTPAPDDVPSEEPIATPEPSPEPIIEPTDATGADHRARRRGTHGVDRARRRPRRRT